MSRVFAGIASLFLAGAIWVLAEHTYRLMQVEAVVPVPPAAATAGNMPLPAEPALELPAPENFAAIVERPIFSQSRRPAEVAAEVQQAAPAPALELDLIGVVIWQKERVALVRSKRDNRVITVREGGSVAGWVAVGIGPENVLFRRGDHETRLRLAYNHRENNG
jgi:hypothetical protein